ncbi:hypothetical protein SAMN02745157_2893 [Kaistia soli DSM 19436]|uniref:Uncharacterized protein n=1 Tax=Kaistia soli DSM 19436 TaxID=1122133 RepID=A0A1M5E557_9HYPH|nr:hypothetical protein [Kaistia soli]SHF74300.1 hypothetical protein SAMN02745157_2893 [Kaistia soli DSM 19436]
MSAALPGRTHAPEDPARPFPMRDLWWLVPGFALWFTALSTVYALHHIGCTFGWSARTIHLGLAAALAIHLAAIGILCRIELRRGASRDFGHTGRFMHWVILGTLLAALGKVVLTLAPALFLSVCL